MVTLTETFGGKNADYDATLLSDGTLRVLATAAAILSAPEGSLVVIEEIDNGVHPSRAGRLLERLSRAARKRDLRHSHQQPQPRPAGRLADRCGAPCGVLLPGP